MGCLKAAGPCNVWTLVGHINVFVWAMMIKSELEYAGFWRRLGATLIDALIVGIVTYPFLAAVYGDNYWLDNRLVKGPFDFLVSYVLPAIAVIIFWVQKGATPGKMALALEIVDGRTSERPGAGQFIGRYLAYFASALPIGLGFIWVGIDSKKQGWHDKLSGTVVVRRKAGATEPVRFQRPMQRREPGSESTGLE